MSSANLVGSTPSRWHTWQNASATSGNSLKISISLSYVWGEQTNVVLQGASLKWSYDFYAEKFTGIFAIQK